ncbi:Mitochondrial ribonuclease P protein 1-like protein [Frankliniella fusca]|uniref:Mitochondrial ribonuclease P protein 1-like protein n=1 Tax=Frankliniella fusca TaxID=407009 RepID=A0AAE1H198_9NEOP|nr:Mitochondrial ribonuclease P protein 1-like protein [Frankliniella fusca]
MSVFNRIRQINRKIKHMFLLKHAINNSMSQQSREQSTFLNLKKQFNSESLSNPTLSYFEKLSKLVEKSTCNMYRLNDEDIELVTMRDPDRKRRLDILLLELFTKDCQGEPLPKYVTLNSFQKAVQIEHEDPKEYVHYFLYYYEKDKSDILSWMAAKEDANVPQPQVHYLTPSVSCIAGVIGNFEIKQFYRASSGHGMQFGQNLVLDFSSLKWMRHDSRMILAREIRDLVLANGKSRRPFHLHFCSYLKNQTMEPLVKYLNKGLSQSAVTLTSHFFLKKFPRKNVLYLMPSSRNEITYNPEDVYVISPYHDRRYHIPRHEGVRTAKLPYDFQWFHGRNWCTLSEIHQLLSSWKELHGKSEQKIKLQR